MYAIQTEHLTKSYGRKRGIADLNLSVRSGEFFGFIGPNGAGKSTTIRTLLGLLTPTSGSARILGREIRTETRAILSQTGYLPSETAFYPGMKVRDVLKLSACLREYGRRAHEDRPAAPCLQSPVPDQADILLEGRILCERLQLDPSRRVDELSFGSRKKAGIVCALQHRPRLLILDEPTGGLDPLIQREFFGILKEFHQDGATIFLSSHILSEIQRHCTRAAILRDGRMIACDSVENLARTGARRVTLRVREAPSAPTCAGRLEKALCPPDGSCPEPETLLPDGIRDLRITGETVRFLYCGDMNRLTAALAECDIRDLTVTEPDLEEIFLHYYTDAPSPSANRSHF